MSLILEFPRQRQPRRVVAPADRWLARGLTAAYILRPGIWQINLVTGRIGGTVAGTGVTFPDGFLRTPGTTGSGALLEHGLSTSIALPISIAIGFVNISNTNVAWSLLRNDLSNWSGWYGEKNGEVKTVNNNTFNGALAFGSGSTSVAFSHRATNDLAGYGSDSGLISDTSLTTPALVSSTDIALGWSRRSANSNGSISEFKHCYVFQAALTDAELRELAYEPHRLWEPRSIIVPVAAAGGGGFKAAWARNQGRVIGAGVI